MPPETFAGQMASLADWSFKGTSLATVIDHVRQFGRWPERTVAITFDDGYENVYRYSEEIARHGFTATVFLVTGHIGGQNDWAPPPAGLGAQSMMTWDHARDLQRSGWEIGAHTRTHPDLRTLSTDAAESQILDSKLEIEQQLAQPVQSFAYPFGLVSDAATAIVEHQFVAACLTELKRVTTEPLSALPRVDTYYLTTAALLGRLVHGRLDNYLTFRRFGRSVRAGTGQPSGPTLVPYRCWTHIGFHLSRKPMFTPQVD